MRWSIVKNLFMINLLYVNPQYTSLKRNKIKLKQGNLQKSLLRNLLLQQVFAIIFLVVFMGLVDYKMAANRYHINIIFMLLFGILTITTPFFNTFYEDKDTPNITVLPITEKEVFASKFLILLGQISGIILAVIASNIVANIKLQGFNIISILLIFIYSIALLISFFSTVIIIFSLLAKTKLFKKYKTTMNVVITIVSIVLAMGFYGSINFFNTHNTPYEYYEGDFLYNIVSSTLTTNSLLSILLIVFAAILSLFMLNLVTIKNYFTDIIGYKVTNKTKSKNIISTNINLNKIFRKITLKSFTDSTLISQNILAPAIIVMLFLGLIMGIRGASFLQQSYVLTPTAIVIGGVFSLFMYGNGSFSALAISIDYKNFSFLKTLPMNMKKFVFQKLFIALLLQIAITSIIFLLTIILLDTSAYFLVVSYITFLVGSITYSVYLFTKDYYNPFLGWSNIQQLILRGASNLKLWLIFFLFIFICGAIIAFTVIVTINFPNLWTLLTAIYLIIMVIVVSIILIRFKKQVLNNLD